MASKTDLPMTEIQLYAVLLGITAAVTLFFSRRWWPVIHRWLQRRVVHLYSGLLRYGIYPWIVDPHRLCGPWTPVGLVVRCVYWAANGFLVVFPSRDWHAAATRAGTLALVNMALLYLTWSHDDMASIWGVSLMLYRQMHATVGWVMVMLIIFHTGSLWSDMSAGVSAQTVSEIVVRPL